MSERIIYLDGVCVDRTGKLRHGGHALGLFHSVLERLLVLEDNADL